MIEYHMNMVLDDVDVFLLTFFNPFHYRSDYQNHSSYPLFFLIFFAMDVSNSAKIKYPIPAIKAIQLMINGPLPTYSNIELNKLLLHEGALDPNMAADKYFTP